MAWSKTLAALFASEVTASVRFPPSACAAFASESLSRKYSPSKKIHISLWTRVQGWGTGSHSSSYPNQGGNNQRWGLGLANLDVDDDDFESNYDEIADLAISEQSQSGSQGVPSEVANKMLGLAIGRAARRLSSKAGVDINLGDESVEDLLSVASSRASATLETYQDDVVGLQTTATKPTGDDNCISPKKHKDKRQYLGNPCVTGTALAQTLWSSVIVSRVDTVIDATCGNGKDALAMAEMLFAEETATVSPGHEGGKTENQPEPELLCIDIQQRACENTQRSLLSSLQQETFSKHVRVLATSHAPLPKPRDERSVGLIAYNLGYLPGTDDKEAFTTKMVTTLFSLTDAALLLRVGGLLSVMTYPGTCLDEANAVKYFCEGLAMLTSRDPGGWRGYVEKIPVDTTGSTSVRDLVQSSLERVVSEGDANQTWRVFEHKPLGRPLSPILVAAMRIK
eukprot:CAMPEP_0113560680 /NCGR_PEP_ID=MMETSP0015_2-20120614/19564_1 /TAXON_ID=2838 /ORGANISM="Odontella" /LENGTH=453 /DNA_ID=CAMNT_0000462409 /DNA_START=85 /DNA_END=1446 /DNA_ORIENTATION=+ /assembly_acc=CAM_ASM_000160